MSFQLSGGAPEIYENTMVPLWMGRWAEALLTLVSLQVDETVLDVACGTGVTTRIGERRQHCETQLRQNSVSACLPTEFLVGCAVSLQSLAR